LSYVVDGVPSYCNQSGQASIREDGNHSIVLFLQQDFSKVINEVELNDLQEFIGETMAQLEMCFPPGFFDITEHLMIHMVDQIRALGPLYLHEIWTYERFMSILNRYVLNRAYPEGSMIEGYNTEEVIECCLGYLNDKISIGLPVPRFFGRLEGVGTVGRKTFIDKDFKGVQQAHYSILQHLAMMTPLLNEHLSIIRAESNGRSDDWIMREHKHRLTAWLKDLDLPDGETMEEQMIKRLAAGPSSQVTLWQGYDINGYLFYTSAKDKKSVS